MIASNENEGAFGRKELCFNSAALSILDFNTCDCEIDWILKSAFHKIYGWL